MRDNFVLPVRHQDTGIRVDLVFSTTPYERQAIARATRVELAGVAVPFATAEDLILHKLFAGRGSAKRLSLKQRGRSRFSGRAERRL